jgi:hypothetical protein
MPAASEGTYPYAVLCAGLYGTQPVDPIAMALLLTSVEYLFLQEAGRSGQRQGLGRLNVTRSGVSCCDGNENVKVKDGKGKRNPTSKPTFIMALGLGYSTYEFGAPLSID